MVSDKAPGKQRGDVWLTDSEVSDHAHSLGLVALGSVEKLSIVAGSVA